MPSAFGWLDTDSEQRRRMLEVVDLFRESDTTDELGTGSIRDALSDALFPGTSTLHTRLRYVLFIGWQMQQAAQHSTPAQMSGAFRESEYRLIDSLLEGGESLGVIGGRARRALRRVPSGVYWTALRRWGLRLDDASAELFFRRHDDHRALVRRTPHTDDPEARDRAPGTGLDPNLPPPPKDWPGPLTFALTREEGDYLSERIASQTHGSVLAWLISHPPNAMPDYVWQLDHLDAAPVALRTVIDHARRFQLLIHGANLLYNLMLARRAQHDELVEQYTREGTHWQTELAASRVLHGWDIQDWWEVVLRHNPNVARGTRLFIDSWRELLGGTDNITSDSTAADLVARRERMLKGARSRLVSQAALDRWGGGRGLGRHDFRWGVARSHLQDLYDARNAA